MQVLRTVPYLIILVVAAINLLSGSGCANIVPPAGGPRDSLPPVPLSASPKDSELNVAIQKITINFNEFIELKNANENLLISPYPVKQPVTESKLRSVIIRLKDSLLPNTTYTIDFGDAIVDLNEGNVLKNFKYIFSTGNSIDTNELKGRIIDSETGNTDSTFFALLYRKQEDSTVAKEKPLYVARVDGKGNFHFTNIPSGTFYVYALQDADGDKKYSQPSEAFAFADEEVEINSKLKPIVLYAFIAEKPKPKTSTPQVRGDKPGAVKRLTYTMNLEAGAQDLLDSLKFTYQKPLKFFDTGKIKLYKDTTTPLTSLGYRYDSVNQKLILFTSWQAGASYRLILNKDYAADTTGLQPLKTDTINFRVKAEREYGAIRIRFKNLDLSTNPVMLLYSNDQLAGSYPLKTAEWLQKLYKPGDYQVRILFDENKNGRWDGGDYFSKPKRQPEKVKNLNIKITIKPNWDNESTVDLGTQQ
jgi:uncharacterized protein (DUF2141 family)